MKGLMLLALLLSYAFAQLRADELKGHVTLHDCPVSSLIVEISPKEGSPQARVVTNTAADGRFDVDILPGDYLLEIHQQGVKVFQQVIKVQGFTFLPVKVASATGDLASCSLAQLPAGSTVIPLPPKWRPVDMTQDQAGRLVIVDDQNRVLRVSGAHGSFTSEVIFTIPDGSIPIAVAANNGFVYVIARSHGLQGCSIFYTDGTNAEKKSQAWLQQCGGIAADESRVYVTHPGQGSIDVLRVSDLHKIDALTMPTSDSGDGTPLIASATGGKLYLGVHDGSVYVIDLGSKRTKRLASANDPIHSLALSDTKLLVAAGSTVNCISLATPASLSPCMGAEHNSGSISGVVVDGSDFLWLSRSKGTLARTGPVN